MTIALMFFYTYINHFFGFSNIYFSIGAKYFVYPCGTEWRSLIFKIYQNLPYLFGRVWKRFECCILMSLYTYLVFYRYGSLFLLYMGEWKRLFCPSHLVMVVCWDSLLACLLIILFIFFLSCPFFCKTCFRWLSSVCKCSLLEMVKLYVQVNW